MPSVPARQARCRAGELGYCRLAGIGVGQDHASARKSPSGPISPQVPIRRGRGPDRQCCDVEPARGRRGRSARTRRPAGFPRVTGDAPTTQHDQNSCAKAERSADEGTTASIRSDGEGEARSHVAGTAARASARARTAAECRRSLRCLWSPKGRTACRQQRVPSRREPEVARSSPIRLESPQGRRQRWRMFWPSEIQLMTRDSWKYRRPASCGRHDTAAHPVPAGCAGRSPADLKKRGAASRHGEEMAAQKHRKAAKAVADVHRELADAKPACRG